MKVGAKQKPALKERRNRTTQDQVYQALAKRFDEKAWALLPQVRNSTGYAREPRTADAIAVSLWPSRGLHIHGIEIKVCRGDFLREMKNPAKAESIAQFCNFWWLAASDDTIAPVADVPTTWGLLVLEKGRMVVRKEAPFQKAEAPTIHFLAAVLRKAVEAPREAELRGYKSGYEDGQKAAPSIEERKDREAAAQLAELRQMVQAFEHATGIDLSSRWRGPRIAEAANIVMDMMMHSSPVDAVAGLINTLTVTLRRMHDLHAEAKDWEKHTSWPFVHRIPEPITVPELSAEASNERSKNH